MNSTPLQVVSVNQDPGIGPERRKGAAVHLLAMRQAFGELGKDVVSIDETNDVELEHQLEHIHRQSRIELIYERYAFARNTTAVFAARKKCPFVVELNAPLAEENRRFRGIVETENERQRERFVFKNATSVIAVSNEVADYARDRGAAQERVHVVPNGVSKCFQPRSERDSLRARLVPEGRFALGFHGRLRPWHGFERLVDVVASLLEAQVPIHLVIVGEGDFASYLDGRIPEHHRTLVGWKPHEQMARYVATFDALPLTYIPEHPCYFSPLKLMEAMACGVVPIVPELGDLPRVVTHGVHGITYDASKPNEVRKAILWLIRHPTERTKLVKRAVERARRHSWANIASFVLQQVHGSATPSSIDALVEGRAL